MAVRGLDLLSERFADFRDAFILIGGAACDLWFSDQNLAFRTTRDLDIVLILDRLTPEFVDRFREYVQDGEYNQKQRNEDGPPVLYRFAKPGNEEYPYMIELFCRAAPELDLDPDQQIRTGVHIPTRINRTLPFRKQAFQGRSTRAGMPSCSSDRTIQRTSS